MTRCSWMGNISTLQVVECVLSRNPVSFFFGGGVREVQMVTY